jgi:hypothetical protein
LLMASGTQTSVVGPKIRANRCVVAVCMLAATCLLTAVAVSSAAAKASRAQIARWERVDSAFAPAFDRFEGVLQSERATVIFEGRSAIPAATRRVAKAARVVIPAIRLFDARLARTHFTGAMVADVRSVRSANNALVVILAGLDVSSFESQFLVPYNSATWPVSLEGRFARLEVELSRELGRVRMLVI